MPSILHTNSQLTIKETNDKSKIEQSLDYFQRALLTALDSKEARLLITKLRKEQGTDLQSQLSEELINTVIKEIESRNAYNPEDERISADEINKIVRIHLTTVLDSRKDIEAILSPAIA